MWIKEMITTQGSSWLMNKFSLSEPQEMSRESYGDYAYWCYGVKGLRTNHLKYFYQFGEIHGVFDTMGGKGGYLTSTK